MHSFKQFLVESGKAASQYNVSRANRDDIQKALTIVGKAIGVDEDNLVDNLLGTTALTFKGKKQDSGDIDIAMQHNDNMEEIHSKMMHAVRNEGSLNKGTKVGSYAVPVNGKKVQVDLMFVKNPSWAKFAYHSSHGDTSKYPGSVRNIIMLTALAHTQHPGKDFVLRDDQGKVIARASKSIKLDSGMERLYKMAKFNEKTGKYNKTIDKVTPDELELHLKKMGHNITFSKDPEFNDDPTAVVQFIFGKHVKPDDVKTAEDVIKHVKKLKNAETIIKASRSELERLNLPIPSEL